jgi:flagellar hook protein FlgE
VLRSLFSGITGLRQHQTLMDVVSNNISNVNTTGFKTSSVTFEDTLSQLVRAAASPGNGVGGINPAQVGLGVQLGAITSNFTQGSAQNTGKSTDLMIQGDGFFVVRNGNDTAYTRAGAFTFDTSGRLVNPEGMIVQGWIGEDGEVNTDGSLEDIIIPAGTLIPPIASTTVEIGGNIPSSTTSDLTLSQTTYDSAGNEHELSIVLTLSSTVDGFDITVTDGTTGSTTTAGAVAFDTDGSYDSTSSTDPTVTMADGTVVTIDVSGVTMYGGSKTFGVTDADGASAGSLQSFQISTNGDVIGVFSNGEKLTMATIALANFNNPSGLEKIGGTSYQETTNSGIAQVGTPSSGSRGSLLGGSLEMSNVDLAQEFTNLIIAQRGFQANSRVITTSDRMLQDLVDLKR